MQYSNDLPGARDPYRRFVRIVSHQTPRWERTRGSPSVHRPRRYRLSTPFEGDRRCAARLPGGYGAFVLRPSLTDDTTNFIAILAVDDHRYSSKELLPSSARQVTSTGRKCRFRRGCAGPVPCLTSGRGLDGFAAPRHERNSRHRSASSGVSRRTHHRADQSYGDRLAHRALTSGASAYLLCLPTARKHEGLTQIYAL